MCQTVTYPPQLRGTVLLPASKSLSNRALILAALSGMGSSVEHLSTCDDTRVMWRALHQRAEVVDILAAGTAMRFLTAYFALCDGEEHVLTGTERMRQRPIGALVNALRALGADISYEGREGFPPLRVRGSRLAGGEVSLPANVSSQYVSALLLAAPMMQRGLRVKLQGRVMSRPYIDMTLALMRDFGAWAGWRGESEIEVQPVRYAPGVIFSVESDWSAASYWYEMVALSGDAAARIDLPLLHADSLQGDSRVARIFEQLGVKTSYITQGNIATVRLTKGPDAKGDVRVALDMADCPDLAQTVVVTCAMLKRPFRITGLRSLRIKETDRLEALREGLAHFGLSLTIEGDDAVALTDYPAGPLVYDGQPIATHDDHRQAMAFAPTALVAGRVRIAHPEVVTKSYPSYWQHLARLAQG